MKNLFVRFMKDDSGATAIEYGLIAAGISVAIIAVVNSHRQQPEHQVQGDLGRPPVSRGRQRPKGSGRAPEPFAFAPAPAAAVYER